MIKKTRVPTGQGFRTIPTMLAHTLAKVQTACLNVTPVISTTIVLDKSTTAILHFTLFPFKYILKPSFLVSSSTILHIKDDLSWSKNIEERLRKANKVLYLLRRNVAVQVKPLIKLGLNKSLILPVLLSRLYLHKPITKPATKPRTLSEESSEMEHGKQKSELHQSNSAAQHSPLAYVSPSEQPTSTCKSHA